MASRRIRVVIDALDQVAEQVIKKLVLDIVANLQRAPSQGGTPVDTGWARANWIPVIGTPSRASTPRPTDEGAARGQAAQVAAQSQSAVAGIAASYRLNQGKVTIANNVPYIVRLNEGSSRQAPAGFVQAAVAQAVRVDLLGLSG